jgi:hypothetical protein
MHPRYANSCFFAKVIHSAAYTLSHEQASNIAPQNDCRPAGLYKWAQASEIITLGK